MYCMGLLIDVLQLYLRVRYARISVNFGLITISVTEHWRI